MMSRFATALLAGAALTYPAMAQAQTQPQSTNGTDAATTPPAAPLRMTSNSPPPPRTRAATSSSPRSVANNPSSPCRSQSRRSVATR